MVILGYGRIVVALIFAAAIFWTSGIGAATLRAKVVDADTHEPLEGVAVVVVWYKPILHPLCMDSCYRFRDATEVVSNSDGDFSVRVSSFWPTRRLGVEFFKPGYRVVTLWAKNNRDLELPENRIIRLKKSHPWKTKFRTGHPFLFANPILSTPIRGASRPKR